MDPDDLIDALRDELGPRRGTVSPAQAWGVFSPDGLVHAEGFGDAAAHPDGTAFRIASCTKAFTASAALLLAGDGLLDLDESLADALDVPLRIVGDARPTIRDALTMQAGFPTDDPWADRQESLSDDVFGGVLAEGVRVQRPEGRRYEYSNLGYAIVGRIVALRAGRPFREVVTDRILTPLGLGSTAFTADVRAPGGAIAGYRRGPDGWEPCPFSGPGAFSPIGGLFSTVGDLARWCIALGAGARGAGPLPESVARTLATPGSSIVGDPASEGPWTAYGMGLVVHDDGTGRRSLGHSGGYPGFGAHLQWDARTGIGAVVLENATYAGPVVPIRAAFERVFGPDAGEPAERSEQPDDVWPETRALASTVRDAVSRGDLGSAGLYDDCVDQDSPLPRRIRELGAQIDAIGGVRETSEVEHPTAASATWTVEGDRGALRCALTLTPRADPRIQSLRIRPA